MTDEEIKSIASKLRYTDETVKYSNQRLKSFEEAARASSDSPWINKAAILAIMEENNRLKEDTVRLLDALNTATNKLNSLAACSDCDSANGTWNPDTHHRPCHTEEKSQVSEDVMYRVEQQLRQLSYMEDELTNVLYTKNMYANEIIKWQKAILKHFPLYTVWDPTQSEAMIELVVEKNRTEAAVLLTQEYKDLLAQHDYEKENNLNNVTKYQFDNEKLVSEVCKLTWDLTDLEEVNRLQKIALAETEMIAKQYREAAIDFARGVISAGKLAEVLGLTSEEKTELRKEANMLMDPSLAEPVIGVLKWSWK